MEKPKHIIYPDATAQKEFAALIRSKDASEQAVRIINLFAEAHEDTERGIDKGVAALLRALVSAPLSQSRLMAAMAAALETVIELDPEAAKLIAAEGAARQERKRLH